MAQPSPVSPSYVAIDLDLPSDVAQIEPAVALVTARCRDLHLAARKTTLNIPIALSEALSNAIIRGNHEDPTKHVHLRALVSESTVTFEVSDEGSGFDLSADRTDPTSPEGILEENGRGLFLMRQLMDRVEQFRAPRHGVRLILQR